MYLPFMCQKRAFTGFKRGHGKSEKVVEFANDPLNYSKVMAWKTVSNESHGISVMSQTKNDSILRVGYP